MTNNSIVTCDLNDSKKSRKNKFFPTSFDCKKEYKLYRHMGRNKYRSRDGESYCCDYVTWMNRIKQIYKDFNESDRLQFKWALRDKKKYAELGRTIVISLLLALFSMILPPLLDYGAADIIHKTYSSYEVNAAEVSDENESKEYDVSSDLSETKDLERLSAKAMLCSFAAIVVEVVVLVQCSTKMEEYRFAEEILRIVEKPESEEKTLAKYNRRITVIR